MLGQNGEECQLSTTVALSEGMHGIQFRQEVGGMPGEILRSHAVKRVRIDKFGEYTLKFGRDVFGVAEPTAVLADPDRPDFSSPRIDVLEEMPVQAEIVTCVEAAGG